MAVGLGYCRLRYSTGRTVALGVKNRGIRSSRIWLAIARKASAAVRLLIVEPYV
jgi:hypothetical protein